jgi:hypothetical protein
MVHGDIKMCSITVRFSLLLKAIRVRSIPHNLNNLEAVANVHQIRISPWSLHLIARIIAADVSIWLWL